MTEKTQPTNAELLPCPFCGTQPDVKLYTAQAAESVPAHQWDTGYLPLPRPDACDGASGTTGWSERAMRAYVDADRAARAPADSVTAPAPVLHLVHSAFAEVAMAFPKAFALHKVGIADTAVREALAAPAPPPECETEAEKRAFAFGWFKALESERMKADSKK